jgi:nucleoside-diphosphate-sugar epimerase
MPQQQVVVITGSTGYIGSALIKELAGRFALAGFDRIASRSPPRQPSASASISHRKRV